MKIRKFIVMILTIVMIVSIMPTAVFASSLDVSADSDPISQELIAISERLFSDEVIGGADTTLETRLPNLLVIDYTATAKTIDITYTNYGLDTIDTVSSTVTINGVTKTVPTFAAPVGTTKKTVYFDLKKCHETISVITKASDGGDSLGTTSTPGHRDLPEEIINLWHPGSFSSAAASLNYHFAVHGSSLGISNLQSYVASAVMFRLNLKGATTSPVYGSTPNVTRYKKSGKYIDICGPKNTGKIVSYGKQ